ncbi:hypothetical protein [Arachnia propionica]|uniref:Uncharacterized protein n=1 Tax=Arachnia propionica TaxID=1750 RepID=A0A3P1WMA4_9ACTN|nr:hypothetical protein [Arachnia propionica]RRD47674.1 hypothetical protein EII35_14610 [Arachnia propionica]
MVIREGRLDGVWRAHHRLLLARLDFQRLILAAARSGASEREIRNSVHGHCPDVRELLQEAEKLPPVPEGFSGSGPYEICQRYAVGLLTREQLVDELTRWDYPPRSWPRDYFDDYMVDPPGSWLEVEEAESDGLIDISTYGEVLNRRHPDES